MTGRVIRRAARGPLGLSPEMVAAITVAGVYGLVLLLTGPTRPGGPVTNGGAPSGAPVTSPIPSPTSAGQEQRRAEIRALLGIDARLLEAGSQLDAVVKRDPLRGSDVAAILRRVNATVRLGIDRVPRLSVDPTTKVVGSKLEILYAAVGTMADQALGLAIGNDAAYRDAALEITDRFADLPALDAALEALLAEPGSSPATSPGVTSPGPSTRGSSEPPGPSGAALPSDDPGELLLDRRFDTGIGRWQILAGAGVRVTTSAAASLTGAAGSSLRVDIRRDPGSTGDVRIGQSPISLRAGADYVAKVTVRASGNRLVGLRVVGQHQEPYGIRTGSIGMGANVLTLEFTALGDDTAASLWIDLPGGITGPIWLDEASLIERSPG